MDYPPASLVGKLPLGAVPERDAERALSGNDLIFALCGGSTSPTAIHPRVYLGLKPQDAPRPYILIQRDQRSHEYGSSQSGGMAGVSETTIGITITIVDEHYQRCQDLETLVLNTLENGSTQNVRRYMLAGSEYPADIIDDSTGRALYNAVLSFTCFMR